ncbi:MAG: hypothetical protein ACSHX6_02795 [Akkermansiaceae bacterium]
MKKLLYISTLCASPALLSSCALVTVPVKVVGKVATTSVGVAGKVAGAGVGLVTPNRSSKDEE